MAGVGFVKSVVAVVCARERVQMRKHICLVEDAASEAKYLMFLSRNSTIVF